MKKINLYFLFLSFIFYCLSCSTLKDNQIHLTGNIPQGDDNAFLFIYNPDKPLKIPITDGILDVVLDSMGEGEYLASVRYPGSGVIVGINFYLNPKQSKKYHIEPISQFTLEELKHFKYPLHYASDRFGLRIVSDADDTKMYEEFYRLKEAYNGNTYFKVLESMYKKDTTQNFEYLQGPAAEVNFNKNYKLFAESCRLLISKNLTNPISPFIILYLDDREILKNIDMYKGMLSQMQGRAKASDYFTNANLKLTNLSASLKIGNKLAFPVGKTYPENTSYDFGAEKFTLVEFWASWCLPCRKKNPEWSTLLKKYDKKGFHIVGVSLDKARKNWITAIEKDGIENWFHISDLQDNGFNGENALTYGLKYIPFNALIDNKGIIQKTDVNTEDLDQFLSENL